MATLPINYQDLVTPTGALTELPATTVRGVNAINTQINANTAAIGFSVNSYGADPTGATGDLGAIITSLASTLHTAGGGTIIVPPGTYRFTTTGTINSPKVSLICAGSDAVTFVPAAGLGTSPCLDISAQTGFTVFYGGRFGGFSIDGSATPAGVGLIYGDIIRGHLDDIFIWGYTSGIGLNFKNRTYWTERYVVTRVALFDNAVNWLFTNNTGLASTNSFGYGRVECAMNITTVASTVTVASVTTTAGSTSATVASGGFPSVTTGMSVDGTNLWGGTKVAGISGNTLTLSIPAQASGTATLRFAANNMTGIEVGDAVVLYNTTLKMTCNTDLATGGNFQSPVILKIGALGAQMNDCDFSVMAEVSTNAGNKATAAMLTDATSTLGGFGITSISSHLPGYIAAGAQIHLGGGATWEFTPTASWAVNNAIADSLNWFRGKQSADTQDRLQIRPDSSIRAGSGSAAVDTTLWRGAPGVWELSGAAVIKNLQNITVAGALAIPVNNTYINVFLQANVTSSTIAAGYTGQILLLCVAQNGTGGFTFAWPASGIVWFGSAPTIPTTAWAYIFVTLIYDGGNWLEVSRNTVASVTGNNHDLTVAGLLLTAASATGGAGIRLPHGAAPTSPVDGDMWTTSAGLFVRINGVTKTVTLT